MLFSSKRAENAIRPKWESVVVVVVVVKEKLFELIFLHYPHLFIICAVERGRQEAKGRKKNRQIVSTKLFSSRRRKDVELAGVVEQIFAKIEQPTEITC